MGRQQQIQRYTGLAIYSFQNRRAEGHMNRARTDQHFLRPSRPGSELVALQKRVSWGDRRGVSSQAKTRKKIP